MTATNPATIVLGMATSAGSIPLCEPLERRTLCAANRGLVPAFAAGGLIYCTRSASSSTEVWATDGTPAHTVRLAVDAKHGEVGTFTAFGSGRVAFSIGDALYATAGTPATTARVADLAHPTVGGATTLAGSGRYFFAAGDGLYATSGTAADTVRFATVGYTSNVARAPFFVTAGNVAYYATYTATGSVDQMLYRTDGTAAGTVAVVTGGSVGGMVVVGDRLVYAAGVASGQFSGSTDLDVWSVDVGSAAATPTLLRTIPGGATSGGDVETVGDAAVIIAGRADSNTFDLYRSDGTVAGTEQVASGFHVGIDRPALLASGSRAFFIDHGVDHSLLWTTDGTTTVQVPTVVQPDRVYPSGDGTAVFTTGGDADLGIPASLWRTDGTGAAATLLVRRPYAPSLAVPGGAFIVSYPDNFDGFDPQTVTRVWYAGVGPDPAGKVIGPVPSITPSLTVRTRRGQTATATLTLTNTGRTTADGTIDIDWLYSTSAAPSDAALAAAESDRTAGASLVRFSTVPVRLNLSPGRRMTVRLKLPARTAVDLAYVVADVNPTGRLPTDNAAALAVVSPIPA